MQSRSSSWCGWPCLFSLVLAVVSSWQVTTFLEANGRGYWETSEENLDRLRQLYAEVDDKIEGM